MKGRIQTEVLIVPQTRRQSFDADEITFRNQGADPVTINRHLVLAAGESLTLGAMEGGRDTTEFLIEIPSKTGSLVVIARTVSQ